MLRKVSKRSFGCNILGKSVSKIAAPLYRRNGFFSAGIIVDWNKIVGEQYCKLCQPLRISGEKPNCCLYIEASKAVASQMVYVVPNILDRIHQYFGDKIFEKIKFFENYSKKTDLSLQEEKTQRPKRIPSAAALPKIEYESIEYAPLVRALEKLWESMLLLEE
jgi:hypothetical protein